MGTAANDKLRIHNYNGRTGSNAYCESALTNRTKLETKHTESGASCNGWGDYASIDTLRQHDWMALKKYFETEPSKKKRRTHW
jgi:hypothetical protein